MTGVDAQVLTPRAADTVAAVTGPAERTGAQLAAAFPPRPVVASWPVTEASRSAVLDRVLSAPFALDNPNSQQTRRMGVLAVMNWLRTQSGDSWQQRWVASGGEDQPDWRHLVGTGRAKPLPHLSPGLLVLICADVIRPGLDWLLRFAPARHNLATEMARTRDPAAFAALAALCKQGGVGLQSEQQALTQVAVIMAAKGGLVEQVRVGDCVELARRRGRTHACHRRQTRQQPAVLPTAARARRPRPRRTRRDRDVLRPWATQLRATDRPLPDRLPPGAGRAGRLPARTAAVGGFLLAATAGLPARQTLLGRSRGPPSRHRLAAASARCRRGVEATRADPYPHQDQPRPATGRRDRATAGRSQRAHRRAGLLPRYRRVGRRRPGPMGTVGGALPGQCQRRLPQEGPLTPQVPDGRPHPRTASGAADPGLLGRGRTWPHRRTARRRRTRPPRAAVHRRRGDTAPARC